MGQFETKRSVPGVLNWGSGGGGGAKGPTAFDLSLECLTQIEDVRAIEREWKALEQQSLTAMAYFQGFDWCMRWCESFAGESTGSSCGLLRIYTARRNGKLVMLLAMIEEETSFGFRRQTVIGQPLTQYASVLVDRSAVSAEEVASFWTWITTQADCDLIVIESLPEKSELVPAVAVSGEAEASGQAAMMDLRGVAERASLEQGVKRSTLKRRKKRRKKLANGGVLQLEEIGGDDRRYSDMVALAFTWKRQWLAETGRYSGVLFEDRVCKFLSRLTDGAVALVLRRDGQPVAVEIGFIHGRHYYSYLGAFDFEMRHLSPGKVQMEEAVKWASKRGFDCYDLLGDPSTYKEHWSNSSVQLYTVVHSKSVRGFLVAAFWQRLLKPFSKSFFYSLPEGFRRRVLLQAPC